MVNKQLVKIKSLSFYTKDGTRLHTEKVVSEIENVLGIKGKALDFDLLFADQKDILGT